jgi:glycosyltransferase involved in cell wall biosynthesis
MPLKPRIVIAGQVPPPWGGQNIMIHKAVAQFARSSACESVHLPFFFTPDVKTARKGGINKAVELLRVIGRLIRIRLSGPIDLLLYPVGGPQTVPMLRDLLLLPWMLILSRRVVLHFHAAGIAEELKSGRHKSLARAVASIYGRAYAAVVMTEFNRRDADAVGIKRVLVVPHRIDDDFDAALIRRNNDYAIRLLYVGHLCADKGTPQLLEAFAQLRLNHPELELELELELVGECLPPFNEAELNQLLDKLRIRSHVRLSGLLTGREKAEAFGRADLLVFPTVAPYESFGLVLVEAMSWKLPIVASKWRGNAEVLTALAGAELFPTGPDLVLNITQALDSVLQQRAWWQTWGEANRRIFVERYAERSPESNLVDAVIALLQPVSKVRPQVVTGV